MSMGLSCKPIDAYLWKSPDSTWNPALVCAILIILLRSRLSLISPHFVSDGTQCHFPISNTVFYFVTVLATSLMISGLPVNLTRLSWANDLCRWTIQLRDKYGQKIHGLVETWLARVVYPKTYRLVLRQDRTKNMGVVFQSHLYNKTTPNRNEDTTNQRGSSSWLILENNNVDNNSR